MFYFKRHCFINKNDFIYINNDVTTDIEPHNAKIPLGSDIQSSEYINPYKFWIITTTSHTFQNTKTKRD